MKISKVAIRHYIEFLKEIEKTDPESDFVDFDMWLPRLQQWLSEERPNTTSRVIREMISPYSYRSVDQIGVSPHPHETAKQALKSRLRNAEKLMICDPYIFNVPQDTTNAEYVRRFLSALPMKTLHHLEIVYSDRKSPSIIQELRKRLPTSVKLQLSVDESIHDRVWVVNDSKAFVVGTSFGGIGKKIAFILDLPDDDLIHFKRHLGRSRRSN